ncbi:MAG: beta-lactamase family protein [Alphaproteobacteria bacterium]|nr:beta-lactamase family protein [Alphaproteobacteria bacterium]
MAGSDGPDAVHGTAPRRNALKLLAAGTGLALAAPAIVRAAEGGAASMITHQERHPDPASLKATEAGLDAIAADFNAMLVEGLHKTAALAVYRDGELLISLVGGTIVPTGAPASSDTLFQIRSTTKALAVMTMLQAYDRGRYAFDDPVAKHWPEFAANGKEGVTIAHVLSHRAGLPDGPNVTAAQMGDPAAVAKAIEAMSPVWPPGTENGYHASTIGWISDELLRRWEGANVSALLRRDILDPLGVKDVYIGLPPKEYPRMTHMEVSPRTRERQGSRAVFSDFLNTPQGIGLPLSWVGGMTTAPELAKVMSMLAFDGTVDGRRYIEAATLDKACVPTNPPDYVDQRLNFPVRWGLGFILGLTPEMFGAVPRPRAFGHAGGGAPYAFADRDARIGVAFLCNYMVGRESWTRYQRVSDAVYGALKG